MYKLARIIITFFFYIIFWPKVKGKNNIPKKGKIILAGNHTSNFDFAMVMLSTKRNVHFLAKKELFDIKMLGFFMRKLGMISVNRKEKNKDAFFLAIKYLNEEKIIAIFPEATTNKKKEQTILPFKIGAVKMASVTSSKIVPFTIKGKFRPFRRPVIEFYQAFSVKDNDLDMENNKFMDLIRNKLEEL